MRGLASTAHGQHAARARLPFAACTKPCWVGAGRGSRASVRAQPDPSASWATSSFDEQSKSALKSLDDLLGPADTSPAPHTASHGRDTPTPPGTSGASQQQDSTDAAVVEPVLYSTAALARAGVFVQRRSASDAPPIVATPRVPPTLCYVLYYWHLVLFLAQFYLDAAEGPGAGADFVSGLVLDHDSVLLGGEWWRLLTAPFVHASPWALFITLLALAFIAAEVEATLGYGAFVAVALLSCGTAGLADVTWGGFPSTQGALPCIAGMGGALLVAWGLGQATEQRLRQALLAPPAPSLPPVPAPTSAPTSPSGDSRGQQGDQQGAGAAQGEQGVADVEFMEGLFKVGVPVSAAAASWTALATAGLSLAEALLDLKGSQAADGGTSVSWVGLLAAALAGGCIAWCAGPRYNVVVTDLQSHLASMPAGIVAAARLLGGTPAASGKGPPGAAAVDSDVVSSTGQHAAVVLTETQQWLQRGVAVLSYSGGLAGWWWLLHQ